MFWPQVVRGAFVALCILPPTRFALGLLPLDRVSDASGLFNLSRNLGGAIGIALLDTILFGRTEDHGAALMDQIRTAPDAAAALMGIPVSDLPDPEDPMGLLAIADIVQEQAFTMSINEGWMLLGGHHPVGPGAAVGHGADSTDFREVNPAILECRQAETTRNGFQR